MSDTKYAVIKLDCINNTVEIIDTFIEYEKALFCLSHSVSMIEQYLDEESYKRYFNEDFISIYKVNWITTKSLIERFIICPFGN